MNKKVSNQFDKHFREIDKKAALSEHEKARKATLAKTAKLKGLRLVREAEETAAAALNPKKKRKAPQKRKLPAFERA